MELNIKKWEYKKVLNEEFKINLPETDHLIISVTYLNVLVIMKYQEQATGIS
jgi:hypothetical protein